MQFKYTAINKEGKTEAEVIEAGSLHEAVNYCIRKV
jgi:type II secretory pathway component PulF